MNHDVIIALIGLISVVVTALLKRADRKLDEIHVLVNRQLSEALAKIEALRRALRAEIERTDAESRGEEPDGSDHVPRS